MEALSQEQDSFKLWGWLIKMLNTTSAAETQ
jgi:hypothetical protein